MQFRNKEQNKKKLILGSVSNIEGSKTKMTKLKIESTKSGLNSITKNQPVDLQQEPKFENSDSILYTLSRDCHVDSHASVKDVSPADRRRETWVQCLQCKMWAHNIIVWGQARMYICVTTAFKIKR